MFHPIQDHTTLQGGLRSVTTSKGRFALYRPATAFRRSKWLSDKLPIGSSSCPNKRSRAVCLSRILEANDGLPASCTRPNLLGFPLRFVHAVEPGGRSAVHHIPIEFAADRTGRDE